MPEIPQFEHNGISIEQTPAVPPMGPLGSVVIGLVGTAPDAAAELAPNVAHRIANMGDVAKLDTAGNERGTLWRCCYETLRLVSVPIYVVIVEEGLDADATLVNVIGGKDSDGKLSGLSVLPTSKETPTHIAAPGFHSKPLADALAAQGKKLFAIPLLDGPSTTTTAATEFSGLLGGGGTGFDAMYLVDPMVAVYSKAVQGNVYASAVMSALSCFARVNLWESPAKGGMGALIQGTARPIEYNILDKSTEGNLLNRHGVSYFATTSLGGYSLIGNRTVTGKFVSQVGLEYAIIRKLAKTAQSAMGKNINRSLIDQEISKLNVWLRSLQADETIMGARVYLHPTLNNQETYRNGEWHIAIQYAGFAPNEHMVYHLVEDTGIVDAFLQGVL